MNPTVSAMICATLGTVCVLLSSIHRAAWKTYKRKHSLVAVYVTACAAVMCYACAAVAAWLGVTR